MAEHIVKTVEDLAAQIDEKEKELVRLKRMVNELCALTSLPARYPNDELEVRASLGSLRSDQFYGRPLATVIREYLQMRRTSGQGPASVNNIFDALLTGGYVFDAKDEQNAKRGLRESLTKNPIFHRLPNSGDYGLLEWYPNAKENREAARESKARKADGRPLDGNGSDASPATSAESGEASALGA